jgi:hypothetical protein
MRTALVRRPALLVVAFLVLACSGPTASRDPAVPPGIEEPPVACLSLTLDECERALDAATAALPADHGLIRYVQVGPFYCQVAEGCPRTLAARPEGDVTIEFEQRAPVNMHLKHGAGGVIDAAVTEGFTFTATPSSGPAGPGPVSYSLGHCGLSSGIDVDGSFWDPVGQVDADHSDAINAADGTFAFVGADRATFTTGGGWVVQLVRHQGAKGLPGCM